MVCCNHMIVNTRLYYSVSYLEFCFCRCVFDCRRDESTVDLHEQIELSLFIWTLVPVRWGPFSIWGNWLAVIWVWGLLKQSCDFWPTVANPHQSLVIGHVYVFAVCRASMWIRPEFEIRNILSGIAKKLTSKENTKRLFFKLSGLITSVQGLSRDGWLICFVFFKVLDVFHNC